jgi:hypothetical protein
VRFIRFHLYGPFQQRLGHQNCERHHDDNDRVEGIIKYAERKDFPESGERLDADSPAMAGH